jgi:HD-like signal output (HDOD) protein
LAWEACEHQVIGIDHAAISEMALEQWKMPEPICRAVRMHHLPELVSSEGIPLSRAVQVASNIANLLGHSVRVPEGEVDVEQAKQTACDWMDELGPAGRGMKVLEAFGPEFETIRAAG